MEKYLNEIVEHLTEQKSQEHPETVHGINSHLNDVDSDPELEKYLREVLENFREQMKYEIPAIDMPVLDPLPFEDVDINVNENVVSMNLILKQMSVRDLSTFQVQQLKASLETNYLKLRFVLPTVVADGKYNLNGKLMRIFPLTGNGSFSINITNVEISGLGKLAIKDDTLQLNKLDLNLSWGCVQIHLENFLGRGAFSKHVQKLFPMVVKKLFENNKSNILSDLNSVLENSINNELQKPAIKDLIGGLIPRAKQNYFVTYRL